MLENYSDLDSPIELKKHNTKLTHLGRKLQ